MLLHLDMLLELVEQVVVAMEKELVVELVMQELLILVVAVVAVLFLILVELVDQES